MSLSNQINTESPKTITDRNAVLTFGKFKGKSIAFVLEFEPTWLVWCQNNIDWFDLDHKILEEAEQGTVVPDMWDRVHDHD